MALHLLQEVSNANGFSRVLTATSHIGEGGVR